MQAEAGIKPHECNMVMYSNLQANDETVAALEYVLVGSRTVAGLTRVRLLPAVVVMHRPGTRRWSSAPKAWLLAQCCHDCHGCWHGQVLQGVAGTMRACSLLVYSCRLHAVDAHPMWRHAL